MRINIDYSGAAVADYVLGILKGCNGYQITSFNGN
jgi:hypothetical protein